MCGRFSLTASQAEVSAYFALDALEDFPPRYNIAPTQPILMVTNGAVAREALLVRWGLLPHWVREPEKFTLIINARSETAIEKPSFRTAMRHHRTLVPASGFYEWHRPGDGGHKQAYWIRPRHGELCAFGGLMETWSGENGSQVDTGCLLTTSANKAISSIHDRMPVIIRPRDFDEWLDCRNKEPRHVAHLMEPMPDDYLEAIPVSDLVNAVANTSPELQQKVALDEVVAKIPRKTKSASDKGADQQLKLF